MPAVFIKGAIVVVSVVGAAAIAISQIPEVRAFGEDCRRKIAIALHNLGDEINPNRSQQPRFNRPEDAEGFMQPHAGEMEADEESRKRQREELMYWNAIKLENMQKAKEKEPKGPTFDNTLSNNSNDQTYATKTGAEVLGDEGTLRRRGEGSRGMDRGSLYANPFSDENYLDSEADARMIAPEEDEMEDIDTDNDLREDKESAPDKRVLAAAGDYPLGQHYTMQLENTGFVNQEFNEAPASQELSFRENPAVSTSSPSDHGTTRNALEDYQMQLKLLEQQNESRVRLIRSFDTESTVASASVPPAHKTNNHTLQDYQNQLKLLEEQNTYRLTMARQEQGQAPPNLRGTRSSASPQQGEDEKLVDVAEPPMPPGLESAHVDFSLPDNSPQVQESNNAFASIHAWNDSSNASFYSPLPGTPRALSSVAASEPEHLGGDITPTDSISLAGSGEDVANDNTSSIGGGRYDDVMSLDGDISTPGSWTEVGSVVSEDDASHR